VRIAESRSRLDRFVSNPVHTVVMETQDSGQPTWVVPFPTEVADLIGLATLSISDPQAPTSTRLACGGMVSAAGWVVGMLFGPLTERHEHPVTLPLARAEYAIAATALHGDGDDPDFPQRYCASLGVRYYPVKPQEPDYVWGAWWTLRWLIGEVDQPPIPVPLRHPNGTLATAAQIYDALLRDEPAATPQRHTHLRRRAAELAQESADLALALRAHAVKLGIRS
jgi:hypothetical protein